MHLKNHSNEYIEALDRGVFDDIPKSVFAAIAVSYLVNHGVEFKDVTQEILNEWQTLHDNKIVPQKPRVRPTENVPAKSEPPPVGAGGRSGKTLSFTLGERK